jgi:hypothetical protein
MSFQAMAWAVKQVLPSREKLVLLMAANYADEYGKCWPSNGRLMSDTGMTKNTITAAFRELESRGLLRIEHRSVEGVSLSNMYHLKLSAGGSADDRGGSNLGVGVGQEMTGGRSADDPKPIIEPITKDSIVGFEKFWLACPRRIGKEAARKAYEKARKTTSDSELLEGIRRYAATRAGQDEQYTVHPATWLNQGRWADEPTGGYAQGQGQKREMTEDEKWEAARRFHEFWENKEKQEAKNG